jgi:hypothetical protein
MKPATHRPPFVLAALVGVLGLTNACSTEENANPPVLWLDLDGSEIKVRLVEHEPVPF